MAHKFSKAAYDAKKTAHANAKAQDAANPNSVPELRTLVRSIMDVLGMRQ